MNPSKRDPDHQGFPKIVRDAGLDETDARILRRLAVDGRATNAELAAAASVAPSTAYVRLRSLRERGVVTGVHAAVNQAAIGNRVQAMIGVTLRSGSSRQEAISEFAREVQGLPQVLQMFFIGGADDYLVHIAVADTSELRRFVVEHISGQRHVAASRTSVIFEYHRNGTASDVV